MKTRRLACAAGAAVLLLAVILLLSRGCRPFRKLDAADIAAASVRLTPPDVTIQLDRTEIETLSGLLREVRVTRRDDSYTQYCGQGVTFALTMADGTETRVMAYNPFLVIDGAGWRTAYAPCEALNHFANELPRNAA